MNTDRPTLAAIFATLKEEKDRVFILHRIGPHECEAVGGGTVEELRATRCVEVCADNLVERIALDLEDWPDAPAPVLVVTIGEKRKEIAIP